MNRPERILVTALGDIDDTLSATPAIRALRRSHPDAHLTVLALEHSAPQWQSNPSIDAILTLPDRRHAGLRGLIERSYRALRLLPALRGRFDTVTVLRGGANAPIVAALSGAPRRVGVARRHLRWLLTRAVVVPPGLTPREVNLAVMEAAGIDVGDPRMEVSVASEDRTKAAALLAHLAGDSDGPLVVLHPGSDWGCQMWDTRRWAEVADALIERWQARVVITGSEAERWVAERIARFMQYQPAIAAGMTSLAALSAVIERADLYVGVNSGPASLAVATQTPAVVLSALYYAFERPTWGRLPGDSVVSEIAARDTGEFRWFGKQRLKKLRRERRCVNPACIGQGVMSTISTGDVLAAIEQRMSLAAIRRAHSLSATAT